MTIQAKPTGLHSEESRRPSLCESVHEGENGHSNKSLLRPLQTFTLSYYDNDDFEKKLLAELRRITPWLTPKEVFLKYGINHSNLRVVLQRFREGGGMFELRPGPFGRKITRLKVSPELDAHLRTKQEAA